MEQRENRNPLAVVALSLVLIGIATTVIVPWMGEVTLLGIAFAGTLVGIPALIQAQKGEGKRGIALISVVCGALAILLFAFLKLSRT